MASRPIRLCMGLRYAAYLESCVPAQDISSKTVPLKTLSDLTKHNGLFYQLHDVLQDNWVFNEGQEDHKLRLKGNRASNDGDIVRRWCVAGQGLAIKSCLDMSEDLLAGNVVNVLPQYKPMPTELWLICPSRQSITPTVRLLRDLFRSKTRVILENLVDRGFVDKANLS